MHHSSWTLIITSGVSGTLLCTCYHHSKVWGWRQLLAFNLLHCDASVRHGNENVIILTKFSSLTALKLSFSSLTAPDVVIFITDCTGSCHFDNVQCCQWWKFYKKITTFSFRWMCPSCGFSTANFLMSLAVHITEHVEFSCKARSLEIDHWTKKYTQPIHQTS